jgi:hypothetical protein
LLEVAVSSEFLYRPHALIELAGIRLPPEREAVLSAMFEGSTRTIAEALSRREFRDAEPAARFRPPPSDSR